MNCQAFLFHNRIISTLFLIRKCSQFPKGIKYPGFTYYPRHENFKDPPYEPSKLFLVKRIKSLKGTNGQEKKYLKLMKIDGNIKDNGHINVVKNIPPINAMLWKIKHLIEIKPVKVNGELPKDGNYTGTFLRDTGEFIVIPALKISPEQLEATEKFQNNCNKLNRMYLREYLKKKWLERGFD